MYIVTFSVAFNSKRCVRDFEDCCDYPIIQLLLFISDQPALNTTVLSVRMILFLVNLKMQNESNNLTSTITNLSDASSLSSFSKINQGLDGGLAASHKVNKKPSVNFSRFISIFQDLSRFFKIYLDFSRFISIFQDLSRFFKIYLDFSRFISISHLHVVVFPWEYWSNIPSVKETFSPSLMPPTLWDGAILLRHPRNHLLDVFVLLFK